LGWSADRWGSRPSKAIWTTFSGAFQRIIHFSLKDQQGVGVICNDAMPLKEEARTL
jgi:hypothetical protein